MKHIKYFLEFIFITFLFLIFKFIGLKFSRILASYLFIKLGPLFRSKKTIYSNISLAFPNSEENLKKNISKKMWQSYGKILAEYIFIKNFRNLNSEKYLNIKGQKILDDVKNSNKPVIFISGHFDNFELMAMHIEKSGIKLAAIYRPLNNYFLNPTMENIRKKFICEKQIKKGISGTKEILKHFKSGTSIALMIDQRVSEGIRSTLFDKDALTTTIPAQFIKKFNCKIVPIFIERNNVENFNLEIMSPLTFNNQETVESITLKLNKILEKMIMRNPHQWIWSHNRWK
ncbi:Bacterial lipid A biosynthesis acyltransferase [alpha proteobacterium HIMB5]|nr:Bacterial lipid A biosynthesis acyltransferase [alpha proteobacterium HIMB5]